MFEAPGYYRVRPIVVQALQFDGGNHADVIVFCARAEGSAARELDPPAAHALELETPEGPLRLEAGDWIVKDTACHRVAADVFQQRYGPASNTVEDRLRMFIAEPLALDVIAELAHDHAGDAETAARLAADRCREELRAIVGW